VKNRLNYAMKTSLPVRVSGSKQSQRRIVEVSCKGLADSSSCLCNIYVCGSFSDEISVSQLLWRVLIYLYKGLKYQYFPFNGRVL